MATPDNPSEHPILSALKVTVSRADLEAWGTHTLFGVFAGMLYGGSREAMVFSETEQTLLAKHSIEGDPLLRRNLLRLIMEEKVLRVSRGTAIGGAQLGLFTAVFSAVQRYLARRRSVEDAFNIVAAGSATAASIGFLSPGPVGARLGRAVLGSVMAGTVALPLGCAWSFANQKLEANKTEDTTMSAQQPGENDAAPYDAVGDAIQRLEKRVSSHE